MTAITYQLSSVTAAGRTVRQSFETREAGLAYVAPLALHMEEDADHPGCFDIFTKAGDVLALEPTGDAK